MSAASERDVVAALVVALAPVQVRWAWAPLESASMPPSLPLVSVHREQFTAEGYEEMCKGEPIIGDTVLVLHTWHPVYENARALMAEAREVVMGLEGWTLQSEVDQYEPNVRAWQIEGRWFAGGIALE